MSTEAPIRGAGSAGVASGRAAAPKNFIRPCIMLLLREHPAHGYELMDRLHTFGFTGADPGGLYRALRALEGERLVRSAWEPSSTGPQRRIYELTRSGMEELHRQAKALAATSEMLTAFVARYEEFVALQKD